MKWQHRKPTPNDANANGNVYTESYGEVHYENVTAGTKWVPMAKPAELKPVCVRSAARKKHKQAVKMKTSNQKKCPMCGQSLIVVKIVGYNEEVLTLESGQTIINQVPIYKRVRL